MLVKAITFLVGVVVATLSVQSRPLENFYYTIDATQNDTLILIPFNSLEKKDDTRSYWSYMITLNKSSPFDFSKTYVQDDCASNLTRNFMSGYYLNGYEVHHSIQSADPKWIKIVPNSISSFRNKFVCSFGIGGIPTDMKEDIRKNSFEFKGTEQELVLKIKEMITKSKR